MKKKRLCLIPAKLGSKRLPEKNIKKLNGIPLIKYQIDLALESKLFLKENIIVSTESEEIKRLATSYGATVPYLRSKKLAEDPNGIVQVVQDFFKNYPNYTFYDSIFILLPTSPLTLKKDILRAYEIYKDKNLSSLMSVAETDHSAFRSLTLKGNGLIDPIFPVEFQKRSQDIQKTYRVNGAITIIKISEFLNKIDYCIDPWGAYVMPKSRSVDIDTSDDFKMAEFFQNNNDK
jgi:CMP-N,N'-diacetyllegionaminic acid synthase